MKRAFSDVSDEPDVSNSNIEPLELASFRLEPKPCPDPTLDVIHIKSYLSKAEQSSLWKSLCSDLRWNRVCYSSNRFQKQCETPCWSNCYGGFPEFSPYQPMPDSLQALQQRLESLLHTKFNIVLTRLYLDGEDTIAWHTDGREFLGRETTVASISLGGERSFEMKKPRELWPDVNKCGKQTKGGDDRKVEEGDKANKKPMPPPSSPSSSASCNEKVPVFSWTLASGDLFVMQGVTQQYWHHRVPQEKKKHGPSFARININFRYVLPEDEELARRGHFSYYKYTVHGDSPYDPSAAKSYAELVEEWNAREALNPKKEKKTPKNSASSAAAALKGVDITRFFKPAAQ